MPGLVTHSRLLKESIILLSKKEKKTYLLRSIETLFSTPMHLTAGLFGSIGPNIFDYIPLRTKRNYYGNEISFFIHNGGSDKLVQSMIKKIYSYPDKNNEWSSIQRAYLYGFISHIVTDSMFHPFIFYYSGFPDNYIKKEIYNFREQNLLFQYHLDNFFQYHDEKAGDFNFNIDEMLPVKKMRFLYKIDNSIKTFIHESLHNSYPMLFEKIILLNGKKSKTDIDIPLSYLDIVPYLIKFSYWLKRNNNRRLINIMRNIRLNKIFFSDFIIPYPLNKKYNKNILNTHRERWDNPVGKPGLHYESIQNLLVNSCEKTIELWEKIESCIFMSENSSVFDDLSINAYTGDNKLTYHDMKIKRPIRLNI